MIMIMSWRSLTALIDDNDKKTLMMMCFSQGHLHYLASANLWIWCARISDTEAVIDRRLSRVFRFSLFFYKDIFWLVGTSKSMDMVREDLRLFSKSSKSCCTYKNKVAMLYRPMLPETHQRSRQSITRSPTGSLTPMPDHACTGIARSTNATSPAGKDTDHLTPDHIWERHGQGSGNQPISA